MRLAQDPLPQCQGFFETGLSLGIALVAALGISQRHQSSSKLRMGRAEAFPLVRQHALRRRHHLGPATLVRVGLGEEAL